jgi:hypothetical protein
MPMNKLKNHGLIPLLLMAVISISVLAVETGNQTPEATPEAVPSEEATQVSPQTGDDVSGTQPATQTPPPVEAAAAKPIKPFKPTEQIEADSAVTFPIDI